MSTQMKNVPVYLNGSQFAEKLLTVPDTITERALIRQAKAAHGLSKFKHKPAQFAGPDGCEYIRLDIIGLKLSLLIDINGGEEYD
jgi:hypothetical protein